VELAVVTIFKKSCQAQEKVSAQKKNYGEFRKRAAISIIF
jgi:hypothetical protein